jgi:hypothetical protein
MNEPLDSIGQFRVTQSDRQIRLSELAREYYRRTEVYDYTVACGNVGPHGCALPRDGAEKRLMTVHARLTLKALELNAQALGFAARDLWREMSVYVGSRQFHVDQRALVDALKTGAAT